MKTKQKIINYLLVSITALVLTACGGGSGGGSSSCLVKQTDSDGDGFYDGIDPAPNDASNPGDFSTPEKMLANSKVKKALDIAKSHGIDIAPKLGKNPPNLTGYYHKDDATGYVVASETGLDNGNSLFGKETDVCTQGLWYQEKHVEFIGSYSEEFHGIFYSTQLRGNGKQFTYYRPFSAECERGGKASIIYILTANLDSGGNQVNARSIEVRVGGSAGCEAWKVRTLDTFEKVNDIDNLTHMCVDEGKTYLLNETWKNKGGESCRCNSDYESVCN